MPVYPGTRWQACWTAAATSHPRDKTVPLLSDGSAKPLSGLFCHSSQFRHLSHGCSTLPKQRPDGPPTDPVQKLPDHRQPVGYMILIFCLLIICSEESGQ